MGEWSHCDTQPLPHRQPKNTRYKDPLYRAFLFFVYTGVGFIILHIRHMLPALKKTAPDFTLSDQSGVMHALSAYRGRPVVLYFYPKDDTPGCTIEACSFRDAYARFKRAGIAVFGISVDPVRKHAKFAEKYSLPFTLLSDEEKSVVEQYGVWAKKKFMGREYMGILRTTFLIDPQGKIAKIYENVKPESHADAVLADVKALLRLRKNT